MQMKSTSILQTTPFFDLSLIHTSMTHASSLPTSHMMVLLDILSSVHFIMMTELRDNLSSSSHPERRNHARVRRSSHSCFSQRSQELFRLVQYPNLHSLCLQLVRHALSFTLSHCNVPSRNNLYSIHSPSHCTHLWIKKTGNSSMRKDTWRTAFTVWRCASSILPPSSSTLPEH